MPNKFDTLASSASAKSHRSRPSKKEKNAQRRQTVTNLQQQVEQLKRETRREAHTTEEPSASHPSAASSDMEARLREVSAERDAILAKQKALLDERADLCDIFANEMEGSANANNDTEEESPQLVPVIRAAKKRWNDDVARFERELAALRDQQQRTEMSLLAALPSRPTNDDDDDDNDNNRRPLRESADPAARVADYVRHLKAELEQVRAERESELFRRDAEMAKQRLAAHEAQEAAHGGRTWANRFEDDDGAIDPATVVDVPAEVPASEPAKVADFAKQLGSRNIASCGSLNATQRENLTILSAAVADTCQSVLCVDDTRPSDNFGAITREPKQVVRCQVVLSETTSGLPSFDEYAASEETKALVDAKLRCRIADALGVEDPRHVQLLSVTRGSYDVKFYVPAQFLAKLSPQTVNLANAALQRLKQLQGVCQNPSAIVQSMCNKFNINPKDLDSRGDIQFPNANGDKQKRGGFDYLQPSSAWRRIGLLVCGVYGADDTWLSMNGSAGEWAAAFHGTRGGGDQAFANIANGRTLALANANGYGGKKATNRPDPIPNPGVYLSQDIETSYKMTTSIGGKSFEVAFQCRVHPQHLWETGNGSHWIVADLPQHVRPYGICIRQL